MTERTNELRVLIDSDGEYAINNRRIAYENPLQLARELRIVAPANRNEKDPVLVIAADGHAPHQRVVNVMEAARLAGMERLTFATQSDTHRQP
jgi:biopolymer transport protein ExbD